MLARLPVPVAPARYETVASYLTRVSATQGMPARELWEPISVVRTGTNRRDVLVERLAALVGRPRAHLARALPELRDPAPDWAAWRHQPQPGCPRCDARHDAGAVQHLLPHHRYVCIRHRYWIGPPDAGQRATWLEPDVPEFDDIAQAQRRHLRLLRRHGTGATFDAVLTGFLICGHLWDDHTGWHHAVDRWNSRAAALIPDSTVHRTFSASRIFAATYPEAITIASLIADPTWRRRAVGDPDQQQQILREIGERLGRPDYQPPDNGDAIAHWIKYDARQSPSRPHTTFPQTREHGATRPVKIRPNSIDRQERSALWFSRGRRGGTVILHHRHIAPVLVRDWSRPMDGIEATIWASQNTFDPQEHPPHARCTTYPALA
jgi:hypothetical protein